MIINVGRSSSGDAEAFVGGVATIIGIESFTSSEFAGLADALERLNTPGNTGTPLRRLTDMLWALQNDTAVFVVSNAEAD